MPYVARSGPKFHFHPKTWLTESKELLRAADQIKDDQKGQDIMGERGLTPKPECSVANMKYIAFYAIYSQNV